MGSGMKPYELALWAAEKWDNVFVPELLSRGVLSVSMPDIDVCSRTQFQIQEALTVHAASRVSNAVRDALDAKFAAPDDDDIPF